MGAAEYLRVRRQLLQAAAWNGYVASRGLNAADGASARKRNQRRMADARRNRHAGRAVAA